MRHARGRERARCLLLRCVVKVDAAHCERVRGELRASRGVLAHVQEQRLEQRAVAAPHVRYHTRLLGERLRVEQASHVNTHHVVKVAVMHEPAPDDVELAVDPGLVAAVILEDVARDAKRSLAELVKHRSIREAHAKSGAALN